MKKQYELILFIIALFFMSTLGIHAQPLRESDSPPVKITEGWQYRWGDSPVDDEGIPLWTYQELNSPGRRLGTAVRFLAVADFFFNPGADGIRIIPGGPKQENPCPGRF